MSDFLNIGKLGEEAAAKFLENNEYNILARNFECKQGEIDIIASKGEEVVFFEVKTRSNKHYGNAVDGVDGRKQKHIWNTAEFYLYKNDLLNKYIRFDILEVYLEENKIRINQIKNVFG